MLPQGVSAFKSATSFPRASERAIPAYAPAGAPILPSSVITSISASLWRRPTSKSFGSCAGVIFTAPVPNSRSTIMSAMTGIARFISGRSAFLPTRCVYRSSSGFTATAVAPNIVSGRVDATQPVPLLPPAVSAPSHLPLPTHARAEHASQRRPRRHLPQYHAPKLEHLPQHPPDFCFSSELQRPLLPDPASVPPDPRPRGL